MKPVIIYWIQLLEVFTLLYYFIKIFYIIILLYYYIIKVMIPVVGFKT